MCGSRGACDCLSPDDYVTESDVVVLPDGVELGNPTVVALPTTGLRCQLLQEAGETRTWYARMDGRMEGLDLPQDKNKAIVVGAVGSGAPWFLNGWAEGTEVEFMIDTGCHVTILATSVFERLCTSDPGSGLGCACVGDV